MHPDAIYHTPVLIQSDTKYKQLLDDVIRGTGTFWLNYLSETRAGVLIAKSLPNRID